MGTRSAPRLDLYLEQLRKLIVSGMFNSPEGTIISTPLQDDRGHWILRITDTYDGEMHVTAEVVEHVNILLSLRISQPIPSGCTQLAAIEHVMVGYWQQHDLIPARLQDSDGTWSFGARRQFPALENETDYARVFEQNLSALRRMSYDESLIGQLQKLRALC